MLINAACIPCMTKMTLNLSKKLSLDKDTTKRVFEKILKIPGLRGEDWNITSGEIIEQIMTVLTNTVGQADPFKRDKEMQNKMVMDIYPYLKELINEAPDPLYEAVRLAILGNSIDFVTTDKTPDIKKTIEESRNVHLSRERYDQFHEKVKNTKRLLYIGDNSGEIVIDKLLIEVLVKEYSVAVFFVSRSVPTMNDVTLEEARFVGMDQVATLIENGVDGPLAGTLLDRVSQEMRDHMDQADLIISKGGANFETLQEEFGKFETDISFMVVSKCQNYIDLYQLPIGVPLLVNRYRA